MSIFSVDTASPYMNSTIWHNHAKVYNSKEDQFKIRCENFVNLRYSSECIPLSELRAIAVARRKFLNARDRTFLFLHIKY